MKPSILVVMLDFLVCSLLMFVVGDDPVARQPATTDAASGSAGMVHEEFGSAAVNAMRSEWNQDYEQQILLAQLGAQRTETEQLRGSLAETTASLAAKQSEASALQELTAQREQAIRDLDANLKDLAARAEQEKASLQAVNTEREQQIRALDSSLKQIETQKQQAEQALVSTRTEVARLATERQKLEQEQAALQQRTQQLAQTINSQQDTIRSLSDDVRAGQSKLESQFARFADDQRRMGQTLSQIEELSRALPEVVRENATAINQDQEQLMAEIAALSEMVNGLQAGLQAEDKTALMQAVGGVARGQQELRQQLETLAQAGQQANVAGSLGAIQTGQDALRAQTAQLADQVAALQARKPGPFKAVKNARLELHIAIAKRRPDNSTPHRFRSTAYPPVVQIDGRNWLVSHTHGLGLDWWQLAGANIRGEIVELRYSVTSAGSGHSNAVALASSACVLAADARVAAVPLDDAASIATGLQLAGAESVQQGGQGRLHLFKTTSAGLSFEVETAPLLEDARFLLVKRGMRGVAAWFENPAYRPARGDYLVTPDGKLAGIMVTNEKCLVLTRETIAACLQSIPLSDPAGFLQNVGQLHSKQ